LIVFLLNLQLQKSPNLPIKKYLSCYDCLCGSHFLSTLPYKRVSN